MSGNPRLSLTEPEWEQLRNALLALGGEWETDESHYERLGGDAGYEAYRSLCRQVHGEE